MKKHLIIVLLLAGVFVLTPSAGWRISHAQVATQVQQLQQQLINTLLSLIAQLKQQLVILQATQTPRPIISTLPTPVIQPPIVHSLDTSGFLKSSVDRSIKTEIIIDTDSFPSISNTEITDFLRIANNILVKRVDTEIKLIKLRKISYQTLRHSCPVSACRGFGVDGTDSGIFYEVYKTDPEPEFIIFFREDIVASSMGGYTTTHESMNPNYRNHFRSAEGSTKIIYLGVLDWNHMFSSCGYDMSNPQNPRHISNVSIDGECRGIIGTACVFKNNYYQCNVADILNSPYALSGVFVASQAIHELMHNFGNDARFDHYGGDKCPMPTLTPYDFEEFVGICPKIFENFKDSYW